MDFRKIFDSSVPPEDFDKWRTRYCDALFTGVIEHAGLGPGKAALEIGPGTGQATEPILRTGCSYMAIELGENFTEAMKVKFDSYHNFDIVNADFETYDFGRNRFDLVYSAATIQWIPKQIAFPKAYDILKSGGTLAMFWTETDHKSPNEDLYNRIQEVYIKHFQPETKYTCSLEPNNALNYGFTNLERREYYDKRLYSAEEYVSYIRINASHLTLPEHNKSDFFEGIKESILCFGDKITLNDTIVLYLAKKP